MSEYYPKPQDVFTTARPAGPSLFMQTMGLLGVAMAVTTLGMAAGSFLFGAVITSPLELLLMFVGLLALSFVIPRVAASGNVGLAVALFGVFAFLMGIFLLPTIAYYISVSGAATVLSAFLVSSLAFMGAGVVGWISTWNWPVIARYLLGGLVAIVLLSFVGLVLPGLGVFGNPLFNAAGFALFFGLTALDFWRLRNRQTSAVTLALSMYLDFVNLFLFALRLLGRRR
jgi:FtsH-binding integral membrane protein